jgi:thiol-disulfide isomerase/thioredoxin
MTKPQKFSRSLLAGFFILWSLTIAAAQTDPALVNARDNGSGVAGSKPLLSHISTTALFEAAVRNYNAGKFWEARTILEDLMPLAPELWPAQALYWDLVERTADTFGKRDAVRITLAKMLAVPEERRTEDFYLVISRGYTILDDKKQAADYTAAAIKKFPRGSMAKNGILADAKREPDNQKAIANYDGLLKEFADDVYFSFQLASDKFDRLARNRTFYDAAAMSAAAQEFDGIAKKYAAKTGSASIYLSILRWIAETLSYTAPRESIRYAQAGAEQYQLIPVAVRPASRNSFVQLFPPMIRSANALQEWAVARNAGATMVGELERGPKMPPEFDEASARRDYATTLEKLRMFDPAREQLAAAVIAAKVRTDYQAELKAFNSRHPLPPPEQTRFDRDLSTKLSATDRVRDDQLKTDLLRSELRRPGAPFRLADISGKQVAFDDFRGKVLVLGFWATWCGPCIREMEEMKVAFEKYSDDAGVAFAIINVDADKTDIPRKARESGYTFPILLSDGKIEVAYGTDRIPKLLIIDGAGNIRFDRTGYSSDGTYLKKLDWMIEAARK